MLNIFKNKDCTDLNNFVKDKMYGPKVNIFPKPTDAQEALNILIDHLLGKDWCIPNPLPINQTNTYAVAEILEKY